MNWEVFVPEQYSARAIDGNVIEARRFPPGTSLNSTGIAETITVTGQTVDGLGKRAGRDERDQVAAAPSQNVVNLQARAAGVLPIRVDVPRAGVSHEFIKPLVVGAETTVTLRYKRN